MRRALLIVLLLSGCGTRSLAPPDVGSSDLGLDGSGRRDITPGEASANGCSSNQHCPATSYCSLAAGCTGTGQCRPKPGACDLLLAPVCGCDGKEYGNACAAAAAGMNVSSSGPCQRPAGVTIITDAGSYQIGSPIKATLINGTASSIFLTGCFSFVRERLEDGAWVSHGGTIACVWEGIAIEVTAGAQTTGSSSVIEGGTWRLRADYGVGCTPGKPLSAAQCASTATALSKPFAVQPDTKSCTDLMTKYGAAMASARTCNLAEPVLHCTHQVDFMLNCPGCTTFVESPGALLSLAKQFKAAGCQSLPLPTCPPMACAPKSGTCVNGKCQDVP